MDILPAPGIDVKIDIGGDKAFGPGKAFKLQPHQLAHHRRRAVAADQIFRLIVAIPVRGFNGDGGMIGPLD